MVFENKLSDDILLARVTERDEDLRGHYFRDATAIIHSYPFRRLKHKTQVFFSPKNDHICTRIEHVMHVSTISATICKALDLNGDLAWAIGLGHDLGHTPFGHLGESILGELLKDRGGFQHEMYSLRVIDKLTHYGKGLNLTYAVRDGIVNHCGEKFEQFLEPDFTEKDLNLLLTREYYPSTWEAIVVRMSDKIAYLGRDLEDAIHLNLISVEDIPGQAVAVLGQTNSDIIDTLVNDLIKTSQEKGIIGFSGEVFETILLMKEFNYKYIYGNPMLSDYHRHFERLLKVLFEYLNSILEKYQYDFDNYGSEKNMLAIKFSDFLKKMQAFYEEDSINNAVVDYIAGMTDDYALECVKEILIPKNFETQLYFNDMVRHERGEGRTDFTRDKNLSLFPLQDLNLF